MAVNRKIVFLLFSTINVFKKKTEIILINETSPESELWTLKGCIAGRTANNLGERLMVDLLFVCVY